MDRPKAGGICQALEQLEGRGAAFPELLRHAVELLHESSPRFDWTGIYELYPDETLRLGPFVGAATEHVAISVGQGVCGSAVASKRNMNIPDVSNATNYLACSTETRSELVVLIRNGDRIHAQIDIDSHQLDAFHHEIEREVEQLADWLAQAYERRARPAPSAV
jgi:L-methionine (R)-S-oxide reductase